MLAPEEFAAWLGTTENRTALLRPFPADETEIWPVTPAVGNVKNAGAELIEPISGESYQDEEHLSAIKRKAYHC